MKNPQSFTGIPILFIPGNAGSFRQVRSIGTTLSRAIDSKKIEAERIMTLKVRLRHNGFIFRLCHFLLPFSLQSVLISLKLILISFVKLLGAAT
jgi:hypothetical protein